ncbi:MAG: DUF2335 domain-containing protein [Deltaproteobacteria bacterium]|nr:DUF2335 domain-containing protein [Deltaproteobacteria bacterium]
MSKRKKPRTSSSESQLLPAKEKTRKQLIGEIESVGFSGPLPPPQILAQYNETVPGAAERIITMAETQSKHRQALESAVIESDIRQSKTGLVFGFIIGMTAIVLGAVCVLYGHGLGGGLIGGSGITGLAGVFVYGTAARRKERKAKYKGEQ